MRRVIIYSRKKLAIPKKIRNNLDMRHTKIQYVSITNDKKTKDKEGIELYGYDRRLKYKSSRVSSKTLKNIITKIDKMPMGSLELKLLKLRTKT